MLSSTTLVFGLLGCLQLTAAKITSWALPGNSSFPEGIGRQPNSPYFYTGSWTTGTIWRGSVDTPTVTEFIPAVNDFNLTAAGGIKVTADATLIVAGAGTGRVYVICAESRRLLHRFQAPDSGALINDVVIAQDGNVYVTDSYLQKLYVITPEQLASEDVDQELETFAELVAPFEHEDGQFNANGIVVTADQKNLLIGDFYSHAIFKLDIASKEITKVDFGTTKIGSPDGMLRRGDIVYAVNGDSTMGTEAFIDVLEIKKPYTEGRLVRRIQGQGMLLPSTAAFDGDDLLVANFQIGKAATMDPTLPFTIVRVPTGERRRRAGRAVV